MERGYYQKELIVKAKNNKKDTTDVFSGLDNKKIFDNRELIKIDNIENNFKTFISIIDNKLTTVEWKDDIDYIKDLRNTLDNIFNEIKNTLNNFSNIEQLDQSEVDELILNIPAQTFQLNEIVKNDFINKLRSDDEIIFDVNDVGEIVKIVADINQKIDNLDLPNYQNKYSFNDLNNFIKETTKPLGYGDFISGVAEKAESKVINIQEKVLDKLKGKINSEKVKNLIEKLQQSEILPKVAYGVTLFALGILVANPFNKLQAQVNMEIEDGNLKVDVDGLEITSTNNINELNYYCLNQEIHGEQIDKIYGMEIELKGVKYEVEDEVAFANFIDKEIDKISLKISKMVHKVKIDKEAMRPHELVLISSKIVQDNMEYNQQMIKDSTENKKISNMPLDKLLMDNKSGVCRQYAAAVEVVSEIIKKEYNSPYLKNIKIEELPVNVDEKANHAINIIIEKVNENKIITSYIDATWDDDGKFNDNLVVHPNEDSRSTEVSFVESLDKERFFSSKDKEEICQYIIDNYSAGSSERILAGNLLIKQYESEINDLKIKDNKFDIYKKLKDIILLQGFKDDGELLNRKSYELYVNSYSNYLKNTIGDVNSFSKRENLYREAIDRYDRGHKENYYSDIGSLYLENGNYKKVKEYISKAIDVLDNNLIDDEGKFFDLISSLPVAGILSVKVDDISIFYNQCFNILDSDLEKIDNLSVRNEVIKYIIDYFLDEKEYHKSELVDGEIKKLVDVANDIDDDKEREKLVDRIKKYNDKLKI